MLSIICLNCIAKSGLTIIIKLIIIITILITIIMSIIGKKNLNIYVKTPIKKIDDMGVL